MRSPITTLVALTLLAASFAGANNTGGSKSQFVQAQGGKFHVNGSELKFIGTTAYWLPSLNTEQDIVNTLTNMSHAGIKVVRTWAFNDVEVIPQNGTWFQLVANGTTTLNDGPNGLQKLDLVVEHAQRLGMYVLLSLTNNWNPREKFDGVAQSIQGLESDIQARRLWERDVTPGTNNSLPRNFLSNDYGGMDLYVRQFGLKNHDQFYTNDTLKTLFKNYTANIVSRYKDSPAVFSWEIANDARCSSSLKASSGCKTTVVTQWHSDIADNIRQFDPNHLISAGTQGFFCVDCPKLFAPLPPPPPPQTSGTPNTRRSPAPLTKERLLQERRDQWKKTRAAALQSGKRQEGGIRVRGQWMSTPTRRQVDAGPGPAFDGSEGVDSQDILGAPNIGLSTFQLFPDQNTYFPDDPSLSSFDNVVQNGVKWIQQHARTAQVLNKPVALTGFGLVTQANLPDFVPFNSSTAPFANSTSNAVQDIGVTDAQRDEAFETWLDTGIDAGLDGIIQYQWGQTGLQTQPGTTISPNVVGSSQSPNINEAGQSPNDGYSANGVGLASVQDIISNAAQQIGSSV
ncbi:hypothetical protein V5O48_000332 [Marasmius crinis-equi]|uniref:mannan endo-1,4-beta-mannosidase n=1 Tax=Marasmius crinis-equi TaxID=585013 RepID=A0ABR3G1M9_9AGAR